MPINFYGSFRHETYGSEVCSKTSHGHRSGDVDNVLRLSRFTQKGHNWWQIIETKKPIIPMEVSRIAKTQKGHQVRSYVKVLLTVFFDWNGVLHQEFLPQGRTVNTEYRLEVMRRLREAIRQKCTELWKNQSRILHHDDATSSHIYACAWVFGQK